MIQPAAKAAPKEAIGRSRIRSAALSIRSRPLSSSWSTCSLPAPAASSSADRPAIAPSARSAFRLALPRRISSPAAAAAPRTASAVSAAACLRWLPVSDRLDFRFSVWVGLIMVLLGGRSFEHEGALPASTLDAEHELGGGGGQGWTPGRPVGGAGVAGGWRHVTGAQAAAFGAAASGDLFHQHAGHAAAAQGFGQFGEAGAGQSRIELLAGEYPGLLAQRGVHLHRLAVAADVQADAGIRRLQA